MSGEQYVVSGLLALFESSMFIWMLTRLLPRRTNVPVVVIVLCAAVLSCVKFLCPDNEVLRFLLVNAADLLIVFLFFRGSLRDSFIYPLIFYDFLFLCDAVTLSVCMLGVEVQAADQNTTIHVWMSLTSRLMLPVMVSLFLKVWPKDSTKRLALYPLPILVFFVQLTFSPFEDGSLYYTTPQWLFVLTCVFTVIAMTCFFLAERQKRKHEESDNRLRALDIQHREQRRYIQEIQRTYEGLHLFVHDARHHLDLVHAYLLTGEHTKAQDYIHTLYGDLGRACIHYTGNTDVDSILFSKQMLCRDADLTLRVKGSLPTTIHWLDTADLCILLANALQNAMEASAGMVGAEIDVAFVYRDWLVITVENPFTADVQTSQGRLVSSKGAGHGYGMASMESVVRKYDGHMQTTAKNGRFTLTILLQDRSDVL